MAKQSIEGIINQSLVAYKKNWISICVAILLIGFIEGVLALIGLTPLLLISFSMLSSGVSATETVSAIFEQWQSLIFSLTFTAVFLAAAVLVGMALRGGFTALLIQALRKKKVSYKLMFSVARARWKTFIAADIIKTLIAFLIVAGLLGPGLLLMLAGDQILGALALVFGLLILIPVMLLFGVLFSFIFIAIVVNKLDAIPAIKASIRFGWKNFWTALLIIIIFFVLSFIVGMLNAVTYIGGTILIYFFVTPLQMLSFAALYLGRKKSRR